MKKVVTLLVVLLIFLSGCASKVIVETYSGDMREVNCYDRAYLGYPKDWVDTSYSIETAAVPNKETAIKIAMAIFEDLRNGEDQESLKDSAIQAVVYDGKAGVWEVGFWPDDSASGQGVVIKIQKSDAQVVGIYMG